MSTSAARRPTRLLTQNSEMRQIGVWNWSLPAWAGRLADGRTYNTCPSAGICAQACYARSARNCICCKDFMAVSLSVGDAASRLRPSYWTTRTGDLPSIFRLMKDPFSERKGSWWTGETVSRRDQRGWNCSTAWLCCMQKTLSWRRCSRGGRSSSAAADGCCSPQSTLV